MTSETSPEWDPEAVLRRLEAEAPAPGRPVAAQLFLEESVAPGALHDIVAKALAAIAGEQGFDPGLVSLGKPRLLSNSITATAPVEALRALMQMSQFKALLPANLSLDEATVRPITTTFSASDKTRRDMPD